MKVGYVRVSTVDQNESRQLVRMEEIKVEKLYTEKVSGKDIEGRPELKNMLEFVREGDTVYVHDFSRCAKRFIVKSYNTLVA
ncbi:recombinase family protein [Cetobacterium somerae]|uniref:recombinase family protein n=1 Tax=Cetobacterium somerae TaxID=188913 RepID=UPI00211DFB29|nr:recombinase family protein [Cetobacterium somerae]MCQ9627975.1 recombinase family protein [Cetobacterium somerae]